MVDDNDDVFDDVEERQEEELSDQEKEERLATADMQAILARPEGRRFILRLADASNMVITSFTANKGYTDFNEGKRDFFLQNIFYPAVKAEPRVVAELLMNLTIIQEGRNKKGE